MGSRTGSSRPRSSCAATTRPTKAHRTTKSRTSVRATERARVSALTKQLPRRGLACRASAAEYTVAGAVRVCFVVNNVKTQRPTYTTLHVAFEAQRRGHDVRFVSVLGMSRGEDGAVHGETFAPGAQATAREYCA